MRPAQGCVHAFLHGHLCVVASGGSFCVFVPGCPARVATAARQALPTHADVFARARPRAGPRRANCKDCHRGTWVFGCVQVGKRYTYAPFVEAGPARFRNCRLPSHLGAGPTGQNQDQWLGWLLRICSTRPPDTSPTDSSQSAAPDERHLPADLAHFRPKPALRSSPPVSL